MLTREMHLDVIFNVEQGDHNKECSLMAAKINV